MIKLKVESNSYGGIIMEKCLIVQKNEFIRSGEKTRAKGKSSWSISNIRIYVSEGEAENIWLSPLMITGVRHWQIWELGNQLEGHSKTGNRICSLLLLAEFVAFWNHKGLTGDWDVGVILKARFLCLVLLLITAPCWKSGCWRTVPQHMCLLYAELRYENRMVGASDLRPPCSRNNAKMTQPCEVK